MGGERPGRSWGRKALGFLWALLLLGTAPGAGALPPGGAQFEESQTRAAFLISLAKYSEWQERPASPSDILAIGVLGETPVLRALEALTRNPGPGRRVVVLAFRHASEVKGCQMLYFPASEERSLHAMKSRLMEAGVLTVGETSFFLGYGGAVHVFNEEGRLRFVINRKALDASRIRVASTVMRLAKEVINVS